MKIAELTYQEYRRFDELALAYGSIFNASKWTNIFGKGLRRCGIYNDGGELIGGFITYEQKKFGFSICRNPPFTPAIGPFLKVEASNPVAIMDTWKQALSLMAEFMDALPCPVVTVSLNNTAIDMQPFIWRKFKVVPNFTYILDLSRSHEEIWGGMSGDRRKNVTKAIKDGLTVENISDPEIVRMLVMKTFRRQDKTLSERYLGGVLSEFMSDGNGFAFATFSGSVPIACTFCVRDRQTAYYLLGGYDNERKHHGAGALSMWESIKHAKHLGLRYFDFEGSMIPNVEIYFRGFGGRLTPYYRINKAALPLEIVLKFFKRELF